MSREINIAQPQLTNKKYMMRPSKYSRVIAINQVRSAKKQLLEKMISNDNSDTYLGYILQRNRINANNHRLKTITNPFPSQKASEPIHTHEMEQNQFMAGEKDRSAISSMSKFEARLNNSSHKVKKRSKNYSSSESIIKSQMTSQIENEEKQDYQRESMLKKINLSELQVRRNTEKDDLIEGLVFQIDDHPAKRKKGQLTSLLAHLKAKAGIFQRVQNSLGLCLLKIGKFHANFPGQFIYKRGQQNNSLFFLLQGVISLINLNIQFKKLLFTGDTFGEQMLFSNQPERSYLETAKIVTKSFVLEVTVKDYLILKKQLRRYGNSRIFQVLEEDLRDSFTNKNLARNDSLLKKQHH